MAGGDIHPTNQFRHPELVSGPISPPIRSEGKQTQPHRQSRPMRIARKDIDARLALLPHGPELAARWALKQVQGDDEGMGLEVFAPPLTQDRHAELVSASIKPHAQMLKNEAVSAVCPSKTSAQTDGWTLKRVQGDDDLEVVG